MGVPPLLNLSTRLSTAALPGQTTKTALTEEFMFQNVAYRPTVYRTGSVQGMMYAQTASNIYYSLFTQIICISDGSVGNI